MGIGLEDLMGARAFVKYVKERTVGYEPTYQKFMDLINEVNYKDLNLFEDEINGDKLEKEMGR